MAFAKTIHFIKTCASIFIDFFTDLHCIECGANLEHGEYGVCQKCINDKNLFNRMLVQHKGNWIEKKLYGITRVQVASALMMYEKGTISQELIHRLKYSGYRKIAITLGHAIGNNIINNNRYGHIDYIVPVPLHHKKKTKRSYNQSEEIAVNIAEIIDAIVITDNLIRKTEGKSHASSSFEERIMSQGNFYVKDPDFFESKSILLVDDVFTTGSTIIDCCKAFNSVQNLTIYVYTASAVIV